MFSMQEIEYKSKAGIDELARKAVVIAVATGFELECLVTLETRS
jgi:hypothetical protein